MVIGKNNSWVRSSASRRQDGRTRIICVILNLILMYGISKHIFSIADTDHVWVQNARLLYGRAHRPVGMNT